MMHRKLIGTVSMSLKSWISWRLLSIQFLALTKANIYLTIYMSNNEEARFAVTPSFVLTHSSDSI